METNILVLPEINLFVVELNVTDTRIKEMKEEYMPLKVNGIEDKAGLKMVYESRQIVKKTRVSVVKYADELKEKAVSWQKKVNMEKNRVIGELESIEAHLQAEEDKVTIEKEQLRLAAAKQEEARVQKRIDALAAYGFAIDFNTIKTIDDTSFEIVLNNAKSEHEKELAAKAEEARMQKLEQERLISERKELEELRAKQAEAQRIIEAENLRIKKEQEAKEAVIHAEQKRIEDEKRNIEQQQQRDAADKLRAEEMEKAKIAAVEKEKFRQIEAAKQEKIQEEEKLAMASDKVKFQTVIGMIGGINIPEMKSAKSKKLAGDVKDLLAKIRDHILSNLK